MRAQYYLIVLFILIAFAGIPFLSAQTADLDEFEQMLLEEIEIEEPVYKPVIALGIGKFGFSGDVNDYYRSILGTQPGFKVNVSTFIDNRRFYKLNFFMLYGNLSGNERSYRQPDRNLNFKSEIINFGLSFEYSFKHLFGHFRTINPFLSVGAESFQFNSKADMYDSQGRRYQYWSDGTIRDIPENAPNAHESVFIQRNYIYETDLRAANLYGLGDYPQLSFAIPVDYGLDFRLSDRVNMRIGSSVHFTFTDLIDNVSRKGQGIISNPRNDRFTYSYLTLHFDLFSDPESFIVERLFADIEFDYTLIEDEDGDGVFDFWDKCPNTPPGVEVDEYGCPIDSDGDGVPDYRDLEPNTRPGAFVDEHGREITPDQLADSLNKSENAVRRSEIDLYHHTPPYDLSRLTRKSDSGIPGKFLFLDVDGDGFISFEELIRAIDMFFDGEGGLTVEDIYELNDFFFSQ